MMKALSKQNITLLVGVLASLGTIGGEVAKDGKVDEKDLGQLLPLVPVLQDILTIKYSEIPTEFSKITKEDMADLIEEFKTKFDWPDDVIEQKIEKGFELLNEGYLYVDKLIDYVKGFKI